LNNQKNIVHLRRKKKFTLSNRSKAKKQGQAANIFDKHYITASSHLTLPANATAEHNLQIHYYYHFS
jgi:hypothetical protein